MKLTPEERDKKVALQKQIQSAVLTGKGWELIPKDERRAADTPWFQSLLTFDPAKVDQGRSSSRSSSCTARSTSRCRPRTPIALPIWRASKATPKSVDVVVVRGVNHLLMPAFTGEVTEYASLTDRNVSKDVSGALTAWLTKTFAAIKTLGAVRGTR